MLDPIPEADRRERLALMPLTFDPRPDLPEPPLWEQWRETYAERGAAELRAESQALIVDEHRLAEADVPDRLALAIIDMRLTLIEERLSELAPA